MEPRLNKMEFIEVSYIIHYLNQIILPVSIVFWWMSHIHLLKLNESIKTYFIDCKMYTSKYFNPSEIRLHLIIKGMLQLLSVSGTHDVCEKLPLTPSGRAKKNQLLIFSEIWFYK